MLVLAVVGSTAGCSSTGYGTGGGTTPVPATPGATPAAEQAATPAGGLAGIEWRIVGIGGEAVGDSAQASMVFDPDGRVSGSTGCNNFTGKATIESPNLTLSPLVTTRRACTPEAMSREQKFLSAVEGVRSFAADDDGGVRLLGADGSPLLRLKKAAP